MFIVTIDGQQLWLRHVDQPGMKKTKQKTEKMSTII